MTPEEFIEWLAHAATNKCEFFQLPASVLIAQGILESGWGTSIIGEYNIFGRKWGGWGNYVEVPTQECIDGECVDTVAKFQDYDNLYQACDDWCVLISQDEKYDYPYGIWNATHDIEQFVSALADVYATDPDYADKILSTIKANELMKYDV